MNKKIGKVFLLIGLGFLILGIILGIYAFSKDVSNFKALIPVVLGVIYIPIVIYYLFFSSRSKKSQRSTYKKLPGVTGSDDSENVE